MTELPGHAVNLECRCGWRGRSFELEVARGDKLKCPACHADLDLTPHPVAGPFSSENEGKDWHRSLEGAQARAGEMRKRKLASIQKQIKRLESLTFAPKPGADHGG